MADPLPTRLHIDPPMRDWQATPRNGRTKPLIATGHQPTLWHPGILAKDLAADAFAKHLGGSALHVVVDYDVVDPTTIDVPTIKGPSLTIDRLRLSQAALPVGVPANALPSIDRPYAVQAVCDLRDTFNDARSPRVSVESGLADLASAIESGDEATNLAAQISTTVHKLGSKFADVPRVMGSGLVTQGFVDRLLADPVGCVRSYNRAAWAYPEAGIRPLYLGREVVEAPLWAQGQGPRTPVFVDLGDSKRPQLFTQGQTLDLTGPDALRHLRPRALSLSALMRSERCDLFIHGTGGGVYDQVTERWWQDWVGESLAPMAVVSADVYLPMDVPTATRDELAQAQWYAHHLRHNVDRFFEQQDEIDIALSTEKHHLLDRMHDDRDKRRRAKAFKRIHAINAELRRRHSVLIRSAQQLADEATLGLSNAAIARRRDWCFALYPDHQLDGLKQQVHASLTR